MNPYPRTPEQIAAQMAAWDKPERRKTDRASIQARAEFDRDMPDFPQDLGPQRMSNEEIIHRCYGTATAIRIREVEQRHPETGIPTFTPPCETYNFPKAFALAVVASSIFWGVIYLIISGGQ